MAEEEIGRILTVVSLFSVRHRVVNSRAILRDVTASGYPEARVTLLENCVRLGDDESSDSNRVELADLGIQKGDVVIGAVGNLRPEKEHHLLVHAMARLVPRFPRIHAVIVGVNVVPAVHDALVREIAERGLEGRVVLAGFRDDVPALMRRFDVFCITSRSEGSPNVILEAMVARRPIVATAVGGILELVRDGENGLLVPVGDSERLAQAIAKLLEQPDLARRLGEAGRKTVEERTCARAAQRLASLYQSIGNAGSEARP
jgi:glycosyltransferase involved in cell wall biosynthesis